METNFDTSAELWFNELLMQLGLTDKTKSDPHRAEVIKSIVSELVKANSAKLFSMLCNGELKAKLLAETLNKTTAALSEANARLKALTADA